MLRTDRVTKRFGGHTALDEVSIEVEAGEIVALLGPSGSGKTTLLRVIAGLEHPDRGQVWLDDTDVTAVAPHERGIGLMFQDYALFPHLDVAGNVSFGLRMQGESRNSAEARVAEVLSWVGLAGFQARSVDSLSGGEQQRVALARTLAPNPRIVLLDEPVGALDRALRGRLVTELADLLRQTGFAAVHVTHDQEEAFAIADRIVLLDAGRVRQSSSPSELWQAPADETVARFLGLDTIVEIRVQEGTAATPWGAVGTDLEDGAHQVMVRPNRLTIEDSGELVGVVRSTSFVAGRTTVVVRCLNHDLPVEVTGPGPPVGSSVRVAVARDALHRLQPST